jgi:hypothetical protein
VRVPSSLQSITFGDEVERLREKVIIERKGNLQNPAGDVKMAGKKRILTCPRCKFRFDVSYARAFACRGCPSLVSCDYVKCTKCGYEFPI